MFAVETIKTPDAPALYRDMARTIDRLHRRFMDVLRLEMTRQGVEDLSPVQLMMLLTISDEELSVRDLIERGYYLGSNASYNLKQLVEAGYVDRAASARDRRSARLRLSDRGRALRDRIQGMEEGHVETLAAAPADLETTCRTLRRVERAWTDMVRYEGAGWG